MKQISFCITIFVMAAMCSCSSFNEPKEISPTSTEFTSGELAKLIEVVNEPCQLTYAEKEGAIETQYIKLKVKLKLVKESPELQKVDARDINFIKLLSVATVDLVDENETKVQDLNVKSEDLLKLKKLLQGKEDNEETITFEGEFHNSKDAPKWFKQVTAFTPYLTADVIVVDGVITSKSSDLNVDNPYSWLSDRLATDIDVRGKTKEDLRIMRNTIFAMHGYIFHTKEMKDYFQHQNWYEPMKTDVSSELSSLEQKNIAFLKVKEDNGQLDNESAYNNDLEESDITFENGDVSIDEYLDEYEKFWHEYAKYCKKLDKNDPTAMIEYAKLLKRAKEYDEKLRKVKGKLSIDQLNRLNKINAEMMKLIDNR